MPSRLKPTDFGYQNFYSATLTGDITAGTLAIPLDTVPSPTAGILVIEPDSASREVILYTSKGASTVTAPSDGRGYSGSTASAHLQGSTVIMAPVDKWFTALASGELSTDPLRTEIFFDHIASGMVWSGDAYASTRNASMTSGVIYIGGRRYTAAAVTARTFTASKDTYIDASASSAEDGTVTLTYTEVANNAASPALAANSVRIGIIVTGASNIANAGSVNQGEETKVLPIASSIPYTVTDSLGNLIAPRDPLRRVLGYRQIIADFSTTAVTTDTDVTGLSVPFIATGRKVSTSVFGFSLRSSQAAGNDMVVKINEGATVLGQSRKHTPVSNYFVGADATVLNTPSVGLHTYKAVVYQGAAGTLTVSAAATAPTYIKVEQN